MADPTEVRPTVIFVMRSGQLAMAEQIRQVPEDRFASEVVAGFTDGVSEGFRADARQALVGFSPDTMASLVEKAARFDVTDLLQALRLPVLALCGEEDPMNWPLTEDLAARIAGAEAATVPGAGHVANLDAPETFTRVLTGFLGRHGC